MDNCTKIPQINRLVEYIGKNFKSKSEFARKIGITHADLSKYISRNKIPGGVFLKRLSDAGIDVNFIMNGSNNQSLEIPLLHVYEDLKDTPNLSFLTKDSVLAIKVKSHKMINTAIDSGDILIIDKKANLKENKIVIIAEESTMTVKRLTANGLKRENDPYEAISLSKVMNVIGIVTHIIKKVK